MGVDWWTVRIAVSKHFKADLHQVRTRWAFADQVDAHIVIDALDDAEANYRPKQKAKGGP